ncbi:MAG: divalent-cation tolerance protein CutA [Methanotrichaceae archaeon]|nr:divalent-cation tolerance protein CutA [Methanotrichaceae archaeon]
MSRLVLVLCTAPPGGSENIAKAVVEERLAACVNVCPVRSYYTWQETLCRDAEELMIIKTEERMVEQLSRRIKELHSYELPEIVILPVVGGDPGYLQWLSRSVG